MNQQNVWSSARFGLSVFLLAGMGNPAMAAEILSGGTSHVPVEPQALMSFVSERPSASGLRAVRSNGALRCLASAHDRLYVLVEVGKGLVFNPARPTQTLNQQLLAWDGLRWKTLDVPLHPLHGISVKGDELLVIGGSAKQAAGLSEIQAWNGSQWRRLTDPFPCHSITTIAADDARFYLGGKFPIGSGPHSSLIQWDGKTWINTGLNLLFEKGPGATRVAAILPRGPDLLVGGKFTRAANARAINVVRLTGEKGFAFGSGLEDGDLWENGVLSLAFAGTNLVAVSSPPGNKSLSTLWSWTGKKWVPVQLPLKRVNVTIPDDGGGLIVAGSKGLGVMDSTAHILRYKNGRVDMLGQVMLPLLTQTAIQGSPSWCEVISLVQTGTNLVAGGTATLLSMSQFPFVAQWNGKEWGIVK